MAHWTDDLHELCERLTEEISDYKKRIDKNDGKMSAGDLEAIDKLTHTLKSIKTTLAMEEYDDDYSHDGRGGYYAGYDGRSDHMDGVSRNPRMYRDGESHEGRSYARRGRGANAKRDSMGRYSSDGRASRGGYSYDEAKDEMMEKLHEVMEFAPDETTKREVKKLVEKMEQM